MKTKHYVPILLSVMFLITSCLSERVERKEPSGKEFTEKITDKTFTEIEAASCFKITLHKSDICSVNITASEELKEVINVKVKDNRLVLYLDDENCVCRQYKNLKAHADVYLPSFERIDLSGASYLETTDTFKVDKAEFYLSGASEIDDFVMIAAVADVRASGSSSMDAVLYADSLKMRISGASDIKLNTINSKVGSYCSLDVSGSSDTEIIKLPYENVMVNISGASDVSVYPTKKLGGRASGASEIKYRSTSKELNVNVKTSGTSSIKEK